MVRDSSIQCICRSRTLSYHFQVLSDERPLRRCNSFGYASARGSRVMRRRSRGCAQGADTILTALLGCIPRGSDHGDRGDRRRARRAPLEDREMSVCSTKTRTAALSVRTRWRPGPWCGSRRPVRSISANSLPIVVWRSIIISRNCSQNSGSTVIDVSRPLILTWCRQGDWNRFTTHSRIAHAA
jgi:hypothetical protein